MKKKISELEQENKDLQLRINQLEEELDLYKNLDQSASENKQKPKILIVDDLEQNIILLEEILLELDLEVMSVRSGQEATEIVKQEEFALALIDIQMPELDGFSTLELIRKEEKNKYLPVIFVSAIYTDDYYKIKGAQIGAVDFLPKPIDPELIKGKVQIFLDLYEQKKRIQQINQELVETIKQRNIIKKELEKNNKFLNNILEALTYPFYVIDLKTLKIKLANSAAGNIKPGKQLFYKAFHHETEQDFYHTHIEKLKQIAHDRQPVIEEHLHFDEGGNPVNIEVYNFPVVNENDQVEEVIEYLIDITERKKTETELEQHRKYLEELVEKRTRALKKAKEKAEESDRLKTSFLTNISHELRTPMNAIIGFSSLLLESEISYQEKKEFVQNIEESGSSLLNLIDDIIGLARIESGETKIQIQEFQLAEIVASIYEEFDEKIKEKHDEYVQFKCRRSPENLTVKSDKERLSQVFTTLLNNAIKFTEEGEICIGYHKKTDTVECFVSDTGIGIPEDQRQVIFDRFRKIEADRMKLYRGVGLGLTISKKIMEILGGKIWVESEMGKGSTFYFSFPLEEK